MTTVQYTGHEVMTYPGFLDEDTGKTLTCIPGMAYSVIPVSGNAGDKPNDGRFSSAEDSRETAKATRPETRSAVTITAPDLPAGGEEV
jgi:hypothetical protein